VLQNANSIPHSVVLMRQSISQKLSKFIQESQQQSEHRQNGMIDNEVNMFDKVAENEDGDNGRQLASGRRDA